MLVKASFVQIAVPLLRNVIVKSESAASDSVAQRKSIEIVPSALANSPAV